MPPYKEQFPKESVVRVKSRAALESFKQEWRFHNPLKSAQLDCAGKEGRVVAIGVYHGGDILYTLDQMPGVWHEQCLESPT